MEVSSADVFGVEGKRAPVRLYLALAIMEGAGAHFLNLLTMQFVLIASNGNGESFITEEPL
jgi:hypothetical protein